MNRILSLGILTLFATALWSQPPAEPMFAGRALSAWIADLDSKDVLQREEAIEVLGRIGPTAKPAAPKLFQLHKAGAATVRRRAAAALWRIDQQSAPILETLKEALSDSDRGVRLWAVDRASEMGGAAVELAPMLIDLWNDPDPAIRGRSRTAVQAFGVIALPELVKALDHKDQETQRHAVDLLGSVRFRREDALPILRDKLKSSKPPLQLRIARLIRQLDATDTAALSVLIEAAAHKDARVRAEAMRECLAIQPRPKELAEVFRRGMKDEDPQFRFRSLQALLEMDRGAVAEALPALTAIVRDGAGNSDWPHAVHLISVLGPDAKDAMPAMIQVLRDGKAGGQEVVAMNALSRLGPEAVDALIEFALDARPQYRQASLGALSALGPAIADRMGPWLRSSDAKLKRTAYDLVHRAGAAVRPLLPHLEAGLSDGDHQIRRLAAESLSRFGPEGKSALPVLLDNLADSGQSTHQKALTASALGGIGPRATEALPLLRPLLQSGDVYLKLRAAEAVWRIEGKPDAALPVFLNALKNRNSGDAGATVIRLLALVGADPAQFAKAVLEASQAVAPGHRDVLVLALAECHPNAAEFRPLYVSALQSRAASRTAAARALLQLGETDAVLAALREALATGDTSSRQFGVAMAAELGPRAKTLAPLLRDLFDRESSIAVRIGVAEALIRVERDAAKPAHAWLVDQLATPNLAQRQAAASALAHADPEHPAVLPALQDLLRRLPSVSAGAVADSLARLGPAAKPAAPDLRKLLRERNGHVHLRAARAIWQIEGSLDEALPVLLAEIPNAGPDIVRDTRGSSPAATLEAVRILTEIGQPAQKALPALKLLQFAVDDQLRWQARQAIQKLEPK